MAGADFDGFPMYGGRRRCNVLDNGTITAYYGDNNYIEDGSNGQVMVYQPKFYYKVVPLKLDPITDGMGYHLRKVNYYISETPKPGFKLHPAFYDENGDPVNYILLSAYEGSIYDVSASAYLANDEQIADFTPEIGDKLSSIAGVKPCSGKTQNLTYANAELTAGNRGTEWHIETIKTLSANQLLMAIEYAAFNMQAAIGNGVVSMSGSPTSDNFSINTGSTSTIGNSTGNDDNDGTSGKKSVSYRGMENPWGNIWTFVAGINTYMDENGILHDYICHDFNFAENKSNGNYAPIGFDPACTEGCVSAFGYSKEFDWLFIPSETNGNFNLPVGDYYWCNPNINNQWRSVRIGGNWSSGYQAGALAFNKNSPASIHHYTIGARLVYVPVCDTLG